MKVIERNNRLIFIRLIRQKKTNEYTKPLLVRGALKIVCLW
jgi:hypothetical protein